MNRSRKPKPKGSQGKNTAQHGIDQDSLVLLRLKRLEVFGSCFKTACICAAVVLFGYVAIYKPIDAAKGEQTAINYVVNWLGDIKLNVGLAWTATGASTAWALLERRKRLKERKEKDARIGAFERSIDPDRSSSELTVSGDKDRKGGTPGEQRT